LIGEALRDFLLEVKEVPRGAAANGAFGSGWSVRSGAERREATTMASMNSQPPRG
jgi:hypothetical protein